MSPRRVSKSPFNPALVLFVVIALGLFFLLSGLDPLELFSSIQTAMPPQVESPAANTSKPTLTPKPNTTSSEAPTTGVWWKLYFVTPRQIPDTLANNYSLDGLPPELMTGSITEKLIQRIEAAKKTIHIASFETDLNDVAKALIRAKERGVDVRWITDDENGILIDRQPGRGQFAMLKKAGIKVIDDGQSALMHDKFWIFDGQTVWTGSTNITVSGMFQQDNNVVVIESPGLAAIYERQWADMWNGSFASDSPSTADQQSITIGKTPITVLFAPEDNVISHIFPYVQNAQSSIRFMAFAYTQEQLGQAMLERFKKGIEVLGVFESTGSEDEYSQLTPLYCAKAPMRQDGNPNFLHHKVIIIDEQIVITGSFNFTENADTGNNENVIIINNAEIAKHYTEEFQRVWEIAHVPEPGKLKCR
jgi:phosphatidylserine/phosphatidylglycerophosphate/cardiolipin synthase-like enzyme